jgi:hypothetical protein
VQKDRAALAAALGAGIDGILQQVAEEAARSTSNASGVDPALVASYLEWMRPFVPAALDAAAADDKLRGALLAKGVNTRAPIMRPVPPVARRGLFALGVRLARALLDTYSHEQGIDPLVLQREMNELESAMLATLARRSIGVA